MNDQEARTRPDIKSGRLKNSVVRGLILFSMFQQIVSNCHNILHHIGNVVLIFYFEICFLLVYLCRRLYVGEVSKPLRHTHRENRLTSYEHGKHGKHTEVQRGAFTSLSAEDTVSITSFWSNHFPP